MADCGLCIPAVVHSGAYTDLLASEKSPDPFYRDNEKVVQWAGDALVLHATDLDRPFLTYNAELLDMLNPQLERALEERRAQSSISEQVKWILKRLLAGSRPEISAVARELGVSDRTLQRRIIDDGATFRQLLLEARQELAHEYLNRPEMDVTEVAFLLGYEDSNSFYRAFRTWEGTTPSQSRSSA